MKIPILKTALALAALVPQSGFAQDMDIYVYGDVMNNVYKTNEKTKMTYDATKGVYVIKGVNITCEDGAEDGDFLLRQVTDSGSVTYGAYDPYDDGYVIVDLDTYISAERNGWSYFEVPETDFYDIEFNVEELKVLITKSGEEPEKQSLYAVGDFNNWNYSAPLEFTYKSFTELYVTTQNITASGFRISKNTGSQEAFDEGGLCLEVGKTLTNGGSFRLVPGTDVINVPWAGEYYIKVRSDYTTIVAETEDPDPNATVDPRSISPATGKYPQLQTFTITFGENINRLETSTPITLVGPDGADVPATFTLDGRKVVVSAADPIVAPGVYVLTMPQGAVKMASGADNTAKTWKYTVADKEPKDIYVYGDVAGHIDEIRVPEAKMSMKSENVYTIKGVAITGDDTAYSYGRFKFDIYNPTTGTLESTIGVDGYDEDEEKTVRLGTPVNVIYDGLGWMTMDIEETLQYDMTLDLNAMTLIVSAYEKPVELYLVGDANEWNYAEPLQFTRNDEGYMLENVELTENGFLISTAKGSETEFIGAGLHIDGETLVWGTAIALVNGSQVIYPENDAAATITVNTDRTSITATATEPSDFTAWEAVGTGTYTDYDKNVQTGKTLMMRRSKIDTNMVEYKIMNIREGMDLMFSCDEATGVLTVPVQSTGERVEFFNADVMVADINNYMGGYTPYRESSRRFEANGLFDLNLAFYISDDMYLNMGRNTFRLDGEQYAGDFKMECTVSDIAYTDGGSAKVTLRRGSDLKDVVYTVTDRLGNVSEPTVSTDRVLEIPLSVRGANVVKIFGRNAADSYVAYAEETFYYEPAETGEWISLGLTDYTDDIVATAYFFNPQTYKVEIQRNLSNENLYRLINPYGVNTPYYTPDGWYNTAFTNYLVIDCSDREKVFFEQNALGIDLGDGQMSAAFSALQLEQNGAPAELTDGLWGTLQGSEIALPAYSAKFNFSGKDGWFPALTQVPSGVRISIPKPDGISEVDSAEDAEALYYRLDGTKVDSKNLAPGLYLRRSATETKKIFIK